MSKMIDKKKKEEMRQKMKEAMKKHSTRKKIESPLARYNDLDQLVCVICKIVVRNEAVWPVHLNSKAHKEKIAAAKNPTPEPVSQVAGTSKRPSTFVEPQVQKKVKSILKNPDKPLSSIQTSLPADFSEKPKNLTNALAKTSISDHTSSNGKSHTKEKEVKDKNSSSENGQPAIPEGFFDDPEMDAKARNVEYKNPKEEEWEKFLKEIKEEDIHSSQIIEEDLEQSAKDKQLEGVEEQLKKWSKFMDLVHEREKKKKEVNVKPLKFESDSDSEPEDSEDSEDEWRKKKIV